MLVDPETTVVLDTSRSDAPPDFSGKVVMFYLATAGSSERGAVMEYVEHRRLGARWFLVGRVPELGDSEWVSKLQTGIAWDSVIQYIIFDSRDDYETRAALGRPTLSQRLFSRGAG